MTLPSIRDLLTFSSALLISSSISCAQHDLIDSRKMIDTSGFSDSAHHWYDIYDEDKLITHLSGRPKYDVNEIGKIADNILLFQKSNGGWPKNYDMLAILTAEQLDTISRAKERTNTTFDNGATHSQVEYLAKAFLSTGTERFKSGCLKGLDFILSAQYQNGGWPQFYPETTGYRKYITFNDGAMIGVMKVLKNIVDRRPEYMMVDSARYLKSKEAFSRGIDCILGCQINQNGRPAVWGQQHDNIDLRPRGARTFEPAGLCGDESAGIVQFLMSIDRPDRRIIEAVQNAVRWFHESRIMGIRVKTISAPTEVYKYSTTSIDRIVIEDPSAPPIWARLYELGTNRALFCNRDGIPVYSLAEVDRERRSGYTWYHYEPAEVFKKYPGWRKIWVSDNNLLK